MKSKYLIPLLFGLIVFQNSIALAGPYKAKLSGNLKPLEFLYNSEQVFGLLKDGQLPRLEKPINLTIRIPGQGRAELSLTNIRSRNWQAVTNNKKDLSRQIFFQGKIRPVRLGSQRLPVAASVYEKNGKSWLQINFRAQRTSSRNLLTYYQTDAALASIENSGSAEVNRVPGSVLGKHKCGANGTVQSLSAGNAEHQAIQGLVNLSTAATLPAAVKVLDIRTRADSFWTNTFGSSNGNTQIAAIVNTADAIYRSDLNLAFNIVEQVISDSGLTTSTNPEVLLEQFVVNTSASQYATADVHHLFTSRSIDDNVIGLAYLGVVCGPRVISPQIYGSFGLMQHTNSSINYITFGHEIGHNLAATHDWSPDCSAAGYFDEVSLGAQPLCSSGAARSIMYPSVSTSMSSFSTGSRNQIASYVSSFATCLGSSVTATPTAVPTGPPGTTPTATPTSGGGGGGGTVPLTPTPTIAVPSLTIAGQLSSAGAFNATITSSGGGDADCVISLALTNDQKFRLAKTIKVAAGDALTSSVSLTINRKALPTRKSKAPVYVRAEYTCPDSGAFSSSQKLTLNAAGVISKTRALALSDWIKYLRVKIGKAVL